MTMVRRMSAGVSAAMLAAGVLAVGVLAASCGGGSESEAPAAPAAPVVNPVDPATAGNVSGRVSFEGTAPVAAAVRMDSDPNCTPRGSGGTDESVVVANGAL